MAVFSTLFSVFFFALEVNSADLPLKWSELPQRLTISRRFPTAEVFQNNLYAIGGLPNDGQRRTVERLDLTNANDNFQVIGPTSDDVQPWFAAGSGSTVVNGNLYVSCEDSADGFVWAYEPNDTPQWILVGTMPNPVEDCCMVGSSERDELYIIGGEANNIESDVIQILNLNTGVWRISSAMNEPRGDMGCTIIDDDQIFMIGGADVNGDIGSGELYDIESDSYTLYNNVLQPPRRGNGAIYIPDSDYVLVIGGTDLIDGARTYFNDVRLWNLETQSFINTQGIVNNLADPRARFGITLAQNDDDDDEVTVYLVGGEFLTINGRDAYDNVLTLRIDEDALDDLESENEDSDDEDD